MRRKNPIIKVSKDNGNGYYTIAMAGEHAYVHRLVAICFVPNMFSYPEIDHINGIKNDNRAENLRWVTRKENMANPITKIKHRAHSDNQRKPIVQLDAATGAFIKEWDGITEAANALGLQRTNVGKIANQETKKQTAGGFVFTFKDDYDPSKNYSIRYKRGGSPLKACENDTAVVIFRNGKIVMLFSDTHAAADYYGCEISAISNRCRKKKHFQARITSFTQDFMMYLKDLSPELREYVRNNYSKLLMAVSEQTKGGAGVCRKSCRRGTKNPSENTLEGHCRDSHGPRQDENAND